MTEPTATVQHARDYTGDQEISDSKARDLLEDASDWISGMTVPPDPITAEYTKKRRRCELRVFEYLASPAVLVSRTGVASLSKSYSSSAREDIIAIVESVMHEYIESSAGESGTAYVSSWPIQRG